MSEQEQPQEIKDDKNNDNINNEDKNVNVDYFPSEEEAENDNNLKEDNNEINVKIQVVFKTPLLLFCDKFRHF